VADRPIGSGRPIVACSPEAIRPQGFALARRLPYLPAMTDLLLKRAGRRGDESYDVIADGQVVGRIMMFADTPAGRPRMWSLAYGQDEDRTPRTATSPPARPPFSSRAATPCTYTPSLQYQEQSAR
jgi:hypothetical protein